MANAWEQRFEMVYLRRIVPIVAAVCLAIPGLIAVAKPASAAITTNFSADSGVSSVTGVIAWIDSEHFDLEDVHLHDTSCDNRSARMRITTNLGDPIDVHVDDRGCGTETYYQELDYSGGGSPFDWVEVKVDACNSWGCSSVGFSGLKYNPY